MEVGASKNRRIWSSGTLKLRHKNQLRGNTEENKGCNVLSDEIRI